MFRTSNPTLTRVSNIHEEVRKPATYKGISLKTLLLLFLTAISAVLSVMATNNTFGNNWAGNGLLFGINYLVLLVIASAGALVSVMIASFIPKIAGIFAPIYAICEGLMIGFVSLIFEELYSGVVFSALMATVITFCVMTLLYRSEIIRATTKFRQVLYTSLIALVVSQVAFLLLTLLFPTVMLNFTSSFWLQMLISVILIIIASLCLISDLAVIQMTVEQGLDKKYEWIASLGLVVTLVWLYMQFLRLFALLSSKSD
ncbi:MAG: Bax inhibitor-1/YccA family protein [Clostridia bacterium]